MTIYDWFSWLVLNDNESQWMISESSWCTLLMLQQWQDTQSYTRQIMNSNHSQHDDDNLPRTSRHWQFEGSCLGLSRRTRRRVSWRKWKTWRLESASGKQRTSIYRPLHFCESVQSFFQTQQESNMTWTCYRWCLDCKVSQYVWRLRVPCSTIPNNTSCPIPVFGRQTSKVHLLWFAFFYFPVVKSSNLRFGHVFGRWNCRTGKRSCKG